MSTSASHPSEPNEACTRRRFVQAAALGAGAFTCPTAAFGEAFLLSASDHDEEFLAAARAGDLATVQRHLGQRPDLIDTVDARGRSAFALAHLHGHDVVGDALIASGHAPDAHEAALALDWERFSTQTEAEPGVVHRDHPIGGNAMFCAAAGGAGADLWRAYGATASPNPTPPAGSTSPLQVALRFPGLRTAEMTAAMLLGNSADANPAPNAEPPPLHIAAERGSVELVEMLLRRGADASARDKDGHTAIQAAEAARKSAVVELLGRQVQIPRTCSTSRTAFDVDGEPYSPPPIAEISIFERERFVGASHGNLEYVKKAVAQDPRLAHSVATTGEICIEACAHTGRKEVVELLLENGAPYSLPTAVMRGDLLRAEELLDGDPLRIHERGAHDFALLWYPVIGRCEIEMTEFLLERGAKVEEQHYLGTTALHWASLRGSLEVVELLIERGADVNRPGRRFDAAGQTPLQCAESRDRPEIARLLRARGAKG